MAAFFVIVEVKRAILTSAHNGSPGRSPTRSVHAIIIMQSRIDRGSRQTQQNGSPKKLLKLLFVLGKG